MCVVAVVSCRLSLWLLLSCCVVAVCGMLFVGNCFLAGVAVIVCCCYRLLSVGVVC